MKFFKNPLLFLMGGGTYVGVELLWRGRSHWSMFLAGGTCFLLLGQLRKAKLPAALRGFAGAGIITVVELAAGLLVNRRYTVWDYRDLPLNFLGQICLPFYFLWVPLSMAAMGLHGLTEKWLFADRRQGAAWALSPSCKPCDRKSKDR